MEQTFTPRTLAFTLLLGALLVVLAGSAWFSAPQTTSAATNGKIDGWAWSETIGWIDLNELTLNTNDTIVGYSWSENIGWVRFGGLSGWPTGSGTTADNAKVSGTSLVGWARACTVFISGCSGTLKASSETGGWDGWIALSGTGYSVSTTGGASSFAWGGDVVGWINFNEVTVSPVTYTLTVLKSGSGTVSGTGISCGSDCLETVNDGAVITLTATPAGGYDFAGWSGGGCSGTGSCVVTLTADKTVTATFTSTPPPTGCLSTAASPTCTHTTTVRKGSTPTLYWWTTYTASCTLSGTNGNSISVSNPDNGSGNTSAINQKTIYTLSCLGDDGTTFTDTATINLVPTFQEI